jgi:hypothetical protein
MDAKGSSSQKVTARRAKQGARSFLPGSYLSITISLQPTQLAKLDQLALEIRAVRGNWITRSGIVSAIIEAALRTTPPPGPHVQPEAE